MTERPIIFNEQMVKVILDGRKTQTRRVVQFKPLHDGLNFGWSALEAGHYFTGLPERGWVLRARRGDGCWEDKTERAYCPYGLPGDRLWVRETWGSAHTDYRPGYGCHYYADGEPPFTTGPAWRKRPSIFMPRWASRITLEIADIRVERLQKISEEGAIAEGCKPWKGVPGDGEMTAREAYSRLWNEINSKRGYSWENNPWVWVILFERVTAGAK